MKTADINQQTYIDFHEELNTKLPKYQVWDHVEITKYKNIFLKCYRPDCSENVFFIKKVERPWRKTFETNSFFM